MNVQQGYLVGWKHTGHIRVQHCQSSSKWTCPELYNLVEKWTLTGRSLINVLTDIRLNENSRIYSTFFNSMNSDNLMVPALLTLKVCLLGKWMDVEQDSIKVK